MMVLAALFIKGGNFLPVFLAPPKLPHGCFPCSGVLKVSENCPLTPEYRAGVKFGAKLCILQSKTGVREKSVRYLLAKGETQQRMRRRKTVYFKLFTFFC